MFIDITSRHRSLSPVHHDENHPSRVLRNELKDCVSAFVNTCSSCQTFSPSHVIKLKCPQGPEDPEGPKGPKGQKDPKGPEGPEGPEGPKGPKGQKDPKGPEGPEGPKGQKDPEGPEGPKGLKAMKALNPKEPSRHWEAGAPHLGKLLVCLPPGGCAATALP